MSESILLTPENHSRATNAITKAISEGGQVLTIKDEDKSRNNAQNRLAFTLYNHVDTVSKSTNAREYCKYHFGISILIADDAEMMDFFKLVMSKLSYEERISSMVKMPVTSLMTVKQFTAFIEKIYNHYDPQGLQLPKPDDLYWKALGYTRPNK
jgi:hypothetical protein